MQQPRWSSCLAVAAGVAIAAWDWCSWLEAPPATQAAPRSHKSSRQTVPLGRAFVAAAQVDDDTLMDGVFLPPDRTAKRRLGYGPGHARRASLR